ncbi:hypothetical protein ACLMJK_002167 [Lecanora helva]
MHLLKDWPPDRTSQLSKRKRETPESLIKEDGKKKYKIEDHDSEDEELFVQAQIDKASLSSSSSKANGSPRKRDPLAAIEEASPKTSKNQSRSPNHCEDITVPTAEASVHSNSPGDFSSADQNWNSSKVTQLKPRRIDTARGMSPLDPRSPEYGLSWNQSKDSNPPSRRPSETMPPPLSTTGKGSPLDSSIPFTPKVKTNPRISSGTTPVTDLVPVTSNFSGFAKSLISASSVNVKLDNINEATIHSEAENRRFQKYNVAYHSLMDRANLRQEALHKAKVRLSKQFEAQTASQTVIADHLDEQLAQPSVPSVNGSHDSDVMSIVRKEIADIRKELRALRTGLDTQERKCIRQSDLDRYDDKAKALQQQNTTHLQALNTSAADRSAQQTRLQQGFENQEERLIAFEADIKRLRSNLTDLERTVLGAPGQDKLGLITSARENKATITEVEDTTRQLEERVCHLEGAVKAKPPDPLNNPAEYKAELEEEIKTLRQDLETHAEEQSEEQRREYTVLAENIDKLDEGIKQCRERLSRLEKEPVKEDTEASNLQQASFATLNSTNGLNVKFEELESNLKALDTQFFVQKQQFDNLTTEHLAHCIINHLKTLYPEHPSHVLDKLTLFEGRQHHIENFLALNVEPRLTGMKRALDSRATTDASEVLAVQVQQISTDIVKAKKDIAEQIGNVERNLQSHRDTVRELQQTVSAASESTTKRQDSLQGLVEALRREDRNRAVSRPPAAATPKVRQEDVVNVLSRTVSPASAASDAPLARRARKRKSMPKISDSEDDEGHDGARKSLRRADSG